jgi:hypothetical protein
MIYYNATIINTNTADAGTIGPPPTVRFNETRDAPIVKDASQYNMSIIRFAMNGPNKNLPLFIPIIQTNGTDFPNQQNPNRTIYYVTIPYQRSWSYTDINGVAQTKVFTIAPPSAPVAYRPETQNSVLAPVPAVPAGGITRQDLSSRYYWIYTYDHMARLVNEALLNAMLETWTLFALTWANDPDIDTAASPFPYPTFNDFLTDHDVPFIKYNPESTLFEIYGDTRAFNVASQLFPNTVPDFYTGLPRGTNVPVPAYVVPVVPAPPFVAQPASAPYLRLFFNSNLFGLFTNFNNTFYGANTGSSIQFPLTIAPTKLPTIGLPAPTFPCAYTNEILFTNQEYTNILNNNPLLQNIQAVPPPAYNPFFLIPTTKQRLYWIARQDYNSTNSLWSPVSAIVFTSTMLPVKREYSAQPILLGQSTSGQSTNSASSFEPIISDFVIDQQIENADGYRDFTLYQPVAEYKMISLTASHDEIRNIDIQVYWKYRLTGELIPLSMFNCSDVTLKILFRKLDVR